jgi:hypothetical protein
VQPYASKTFVTAFNDAAKTGADNYAAEAAGWNAQHAAYSK